MIHDEDELLNAVAFQTANSIFLARQRAEQELIRTREALEAKTEALGQSLERAEALLRERDRARVEADDARRAAHAANDAKTRFLNMISHELRTPLGAIGGYAALLDEEIHGPLTDEQRAWVGRIRQNLKHMLRLVNELLDHAKIESGEVVLSLAPVPVQVVLESVQTMIEPQIRESQMRLDVVLDDPTLSFRADRERVDQIVLNLLSNAIKFSPAGSAVRITAAPVADKVRLQVRDAGVGIPADKLESVFEPFVQVEPARPGASRGTGLGLTISRELARAMDGDLTVESALGEGSTFSLSLPRVS